MNSQLRVACVGLGYFSQFHLDAWQRLSQVSAIAVVDKNADRFTASGLPSYTDVETMLADFQPDIVDIITPPATHLDVIRHCMSGNLRAVICQKPFCGGLAGAEAAIALSKAAGIPIVVHENFRFQPWYRTMKQCLADGVIGDPLQLTFRLRPGDGQGPDAYLSRQPYFQQMPRFLVHETAIHFIDTFRFLLGEPESVYADLRRLNPAIQGEDAGFLLFSFAGGVRALFDGNRLLDHAAKNTRCTMGECWLEGTEGTLSLNGDGEVSLRRFGDDGTTALLPPYSGEYFGGDCVYQLQKHVCDAILGETQFENLAEDYWVNQQWEETVYQSAATRQSYRLDDAD